MIRRDSMKWLAFGAFAAPIGFLKPAEAAEPDWRDELLQKQHSWSVYYNSFGVFDDNGVDPQKLTAVYSHSLSIHKRSNKYQITHYAREMKRRPDTDNFYNESTILEGEDTTFDTLEEAYKYAKELKTKYYS